MLVGKKFGLVEQKIDNIERMVYMANIKWISGKKVEEFSIAKIENELKIKFPNDYKKVVLEHNGGCPIPQSFSIGEHKEFEINSMLDICSEPVNEILDTFTVINAKINKKLIPFASDSFGNYICFDYSIDKIHPVVFWEHDSNKIYNICNSFSELLSMLY